VAAVSQKNKRVSYQGKKKERWGRKNAIDWEGSPLVKAVSKPPYRRRLTVGKQKRLQQRGGESHLERRDQKKRTQNHYEAR